MSDKDVFELPWWMFPILIVIGGITGLVLGLLAVWISDLIFPN